jgi:hypothetical protein
MTAALNVREYTWRVKQSARERLTIPIFEGDGTTAATVTGYGVDAVIKEHPGGAVLYTWPAEDAVLSGSSVVLTIPAAVSAAWTWRAGWYRVKLSPPSDPAISRVLQGTIFLDLD